MDSETTTLVFASGTRNSTNRLKIRFKEQATPALLQINGDQMTLVEYADATHLYVRTIKGNHTEGVVTLNMFGTPVKGYAVCAGTVTHYYYLIDQWMAKNNKAVLALVSRYFCEKTALTYFDAPCDITMLFLRNESLTAKARPRTYEQLVQLPKPKISAQHHLHYTVKEVIEASGQDHSYFSDVTSLPFDAHDSMVVSVMLWYNSAPDWARTAVVSSGLFEAKDIKSFSKIAKHISTGAKSWQNLTQLDLRPIFELEVLVNRIEGELDWQAEKVNRTQPRYAQVPNTVVYEAAVRLFTQSAKLNKKPIKLKWQKFWDSRWQWSAPGSIHSQYAEDYEFVSKDRLLKNKFITLCAMPQTEMAYFTSRKPSIHAWSSYKYEWGKLRAIYGTDLTSYVLAQFAFYNCEECLPRQFPVGNDANDVNVATRVAALLKDKLPMCIDFEDFNSQHSGGAMQAVIEAYLHVFDNNLSEEQKYAVRWTADSVSNMVVHDNMGTKTTYQTDGTLLSGWRLTTFMNSVLNYIYTVQICGNTMATGNSLHNGDDVIIGVDNLNITSRCAAAERDFGVRLQQSKCAFAGIAEFLRVDHVRGSKGQYLSRACATLAHSRIESMMSTDARDLVQSMESRFDDCYNRGMPPEFIAQLRWQYYQHQAKVTGNSVDELYTIKTTHRVAGGISSKADASVANVIKAGKTVRGETDIGRLPGIDSYSWQVKEALKLNVSLSKIRDRITNATFEAVLEKVRTVEVEKTDDRWYKVMRSLYKAHKGSIRVKEYGKAALTGLSIDLLARDAPSLPLVYFLKTSQRPMEALPLVT